MKNFLVILLSVFVTLSAVAQKIKGSDTVLPLAQKQAENYMAANKAAKLTVVGGGSGVGIAALIDGSTDIAASSRKIKLSEKMKLQEAGKTLKEVIMAYDALSFVVNPANGVTQLTKEQLEGIFTGKISNWKDVGGADLKITVYARESSSGTYDFVKEHVMSNKNYAASVLNMPATGAIVQAIAQNKGAIGYIGIAYDTKTVNQLKVSYDKGKTYIMPSMETAKNRTYPIVRPLFYYYASSNEKAVKPFLDYSLSEAGQAAVAKTGYITLK